MKRAAYIAALIAITLFALFARTFVNLFSVSPSSASGLATTANVEFRGVVSQVLEDRGLLAVSGMARLSNVTAERVVPMNVALLDEAEFGKRQSHETILAALDTEAEVELKNESSTAVEMAEMLSSNQWSASGLLPFTRDRSGRIQLAGQGQLRIRVVRADGTSMTLVGNLANVLATLTIYDTYVGINLSGTLTSTTSDGDGSIEDSDATIISEMETEFQQTNPWGPEDFLKTIESMETEFPRTSTAEIPVGTPAIPTVAPSS